MKSGKPEGDQTLEERRAEGTVLGLDSSVVENEKEFSKEYSIKEKMQREIWDRYQWT